MRLHDIVNRDVVDLQNCESEPIHLPGSIQPHGFMLAVEALSLNIVFCSANIAAFLNTSPVEVLQQPLQSLFSEEQIKSFQSYLDKRPDATGEPFVFSDGKTEYNTTVHVSENMILLEFEPFPDGALSLPDLYKQTRKFVSFLQDTTSLKGLCSTVAEEIRNVTGYDRVMVYRFDEQYNGEVFAEAKRDDLAPFLGHHYPHTDIPAQARELYLQNLLRIIVDVNYEPVPILTLNAEAAHHSLDLSHSILRSVSPIHIQYLKNMGVNATLTISLIKDGRLWGLVACHHYSPRNLPHYTRLSALLQGHFLTSQISVREVAEDYLLTQKIEGDLDKLLKLLSEDESFISNCHQIPYISGIVNAGGVAIIKDDEVCYQGATPSANEVLDLVRWIQSDIKADFWKTEKLVDHYSPAESFVRIGAGVLYYSLGGRRDAIIWFRPEVVEWINWAGNPTLAVLKDTSSGRLSPRTSFELWKEEVKNQSTPWQTPEVQAGSSFAYALQRQNSLRSLEKYSNELNLANQELENLNWIGTHDLKEPLRKIQLFGSLLLAEKDSFPEKSLRIVQKMQNSAARMQTLVNDLVSYSKVRTTDGLNIGPVDLNEVINSVREDLKEHVDYQYAVIESGRLPVIQGMRFQIVSLFTNILSNALKFSRKDVPSRVEISYSLVERSSSIFKEQMTGNSYHLISVQDNGIGFSDDNKARLFKVFQRLHAGLDYPGTGIGLAICKKIMDNHEGLIMADGVPGQGARFDLYFPDGK